MQWWHLLGISRVLPVLLVCLYIVLFIFFTIWIVVFLLNWLISNDNKKRWGTVGWSQTKLNTHLSSHTRYLSFFFFCIAINNHIIENITVETAFQISQILRVNHSSINFTFMLYSLLYCLLLWFFLDIKEGVLSILEALLVNDYM